MYNIYNIYIYKIAGVSPGQPATAPEGGDRVFVYAIDFFVKNVECSHDCYVLFLYFRRVLYLYFLWTFN